MEIKEFFDSNFSHILEDCSCPDHKTSFNEILERAKKMEKSKETRRRISGVAGGIVGTAAVLAGAVFGLNWLNEHGGLREGGIESSNGAGYHDTAADTTYTQPEVTMTPVIVPEDFVYRFNGFTMKPRHYNYDGMTLELTYDIIYDNGISDNSENDIELRAFGGNVKVTPQDTTQLLFKRDNTAELMWKHTSLEVLESLEIWIMPGSESAISSDMTGQYKFTVGIPEDSPYLSVDTDKAIGKAETDTTKLTHFNICKNTVGFVVEDYPISDPAFEAVINYTDGTFEPLTAEIISVNDMSGDNRQYFLYRLYGTDINTVKSVTVNGREINADGSYEIEFENFIGITKAEARAYLEENNRNFDFIEMDSDEPAGIIFKQEPPAGKTVSSSVTATLYVSSGLNQTDVNYGIDIDDAIEFSDCTVNISGIERYGNTVKMTLDAYAKENCDISMIAFSIRETGERAENENRIPWHKFFDWSEITSDHLQAAFVLQPNIPEGTERTYMLKKGYLTKPDGEEAAYFTITGADTSGAYVREVSAVGTGLTGEEMPIDRIEIDPLSISFDVLGEYAFELGFSVRFKDGRIYTYNKDAGVVRLNGRTWEDQNGNVICLTEFDSVHLADDGDYFEEKNTGKMRYFILAEEPIFDVSEIESINILGAEIPITVE